jgi:hypothetical protein
MPNTTAEWLFWIFSTLVVGLIVGIGVNLITPKIKETGDSWLQRRRLQRELYRQNVETLADRLESNPQDVLLYFMARFANSGILIGLSSLMYLLVTLTLISLRLPYPEFDSRFANWLFLVDRAVNERAYIFYGVIGWLVTFLFLYSCVNLVGKFVLLNDVRSVYRREYIKDDDLEGDESDVSQSEIDPS